MFTARLAIANTFFVGEIVNKLDIACENSTVFVCWVISFLLNCLGNNVSLAQKIEIIYWVIRNRNPKYILRGFVDPIFFKPLSFVYPVDFTARRIWKCKFSVPIHLSVDRILTMVKH